MSFKVGQGVCVYVTRRKNTNHDADVGKISREVDNDNFDVEREILGDERCHKRRNLFQLGDGERKVKYAYYRKRWVELTYRRDGEIYHLDVVHHER